MSKYLKFNNATTILTTIFLTIFGLLLGWLTSKGLNLPITAETLTSIVVGLIMFYFSIQNAKNPNDMFEEDTIYIPIDNLTDEQLDFINGIIEKTIEDNLGDEDVQ